jgi:hypothetical protein
MRNKCYTNESRITKNVLLFIYIYGAGHNGFEAGKIHYKGHYEEWALEIETFSGPEMATSEATAIWAQTS